MPVDSSTAPAKHAVAKPRQPMAARHFWSYGSISYAGMLSFIYAGLDKDDPRVKAVLQWITENYTLNENPGLEALGMYSLFPHHV